MESKTICNIHDFFGGVLKVTEISKTKEKPLDLSKHLNIAFLGFWQFIQNLSRHIYQEMLLTYIT